MTAQSARLLFKTAAVFNWLAVLLFVPWLGMPALLGLPPAGTGVYDQIALLAIAGFGWGYWMAGDDPAAHRGIIGLGGALKVGVVLIVFAHAFAGTAPWNLAALVVCDLVCAALFFRYLRASRAK